jgi:hypothetical protein
MVEVRLPHMALRPYHAMLRSIINVSRPMGSLKATRSNSAPILRLPFGYQVEHHIYDARRDMRVYGHPSGHYFKSWRTWGVHLTSKLNEDLQNYDDVLCVGGWRDIALADAVINVSPVLNAHDPWREMVSAYPKLRRHGTNTSTSLTELLCQTTKIIDTASPPVVTLVKCTACFVALAVLVLLLNRCRRCEEQRR